MNYHKKGPASGAPEIIAAFSARLYGSKSEKLLEDVAKAVADSAEGAQNKDIPK
jgi:hypothetical protein